MKWGRLALACCVGFGFSLQAQSGPAAKEKKFFSFTGGLGGEEPLSGVIVDKGGNFYGNVEVGSPCGEFTCSIVYKLSKSGDFTVLHGFKGGDDGTNTQGGLVFDSQGNLYGTTNGGGAGCGCGTVFKITPGGVETILYAFKGGDDGYDPSAGLSIDGADNLYGTTWGGGAGCQCGTVFRMTPQGAKTILHTFAGGSDGANPASTPAFDSAGNLYGTTSGGGGSCNCGVVFAISTLGAETVLHTFAGGKDGAYPTPRLVFGRHGFIYGATSRGGGGRGPECGDIGCGTVFQLTPDKEKIIYAFQGKKDGGLPGASPMVDKDGDLLGTTQAGGNMRCGDGCGTVYKVSPDGGETVLYAFRPSHSDGYTPVSELHEDKRGSIYGTAAGGGLFNFGLVFKLTN